MNTVEQEDVQLQRARNRTTQRLNASLIACKIKLLDYFGYSMIAVPAKTQFNEVKGRTGLGLGMTYFTVEICKSILNQKEQ